MTDSREGAKTRRNVEELSSIVVDCGYKLHVEAGPGLLETVYEVVLAKMIEAHGLRVRRQVPIAIRLMGLQFDEGFRADLIVEDALLIELKSVENLAPVHSKQVLTYLRLLDLPLGEGQVWHHPDKAAGRLSPHPDHRRQESGHRDDQPQRAAG
jgi:iron complex transport system substrate-binding protein